MYMGIYLIILLFELAQTINNTRKIISLQFLGSRNITVHRFLILGKKYDYDLIENIQMLTKLLTNRNEISRE
jgi:hypothetical protein